ncbi:hypothetical protein WN943_027145 [Citrus x changshan-huyou]
MSASAKQLLLDILRRLQHVKSHLKRQIQFCKTHHIWALQPPKLVSHVEDLESQLRDIEGGIFDIQLELENALLTIYKARSERMRLLMRNNIPADIRWLIEAKVRLAGMVSDNREDNIQFIRDGLNKESLDDIFLSLETHPSEYLQGAILDLWPLFQKEHSRYGLGNLTINDLHKEFVDAAIDLGRSIAEKKLHLVYGGGNRGLSKLVSEAAFVRGSQVLGIIPRALRPLYSLSDAPTGEELVVSGMQERITEILNHVDTFIFIPGDLSTLEALITLTSWVYLNIHQKPIGLSNVNNFYDGFIAFLNHAIKNYFIPSTAKKLFICAHTTNELLDLLQAYRSKPDP